MGFGRPVPRHLSDDVYERLLRGDRLAAARLITTLEQTPRRAAEIIGNIHKHTGRAHIIGITGSPGAGKSTLVDGLIDEMRKRGKTVGVIAVDPSSPFTGGALLGDRIRMQKRSTDKEVFIRSMGSRGSLGGLSSTTSDAIKVLDALGKDIIIIETVGVGQAEVDIVRVADTTIVVLVPGMGDEIQSIKAGIMEIADLFVINKADRDGVDKTVAEVEMMLMMGLGSEDPRKNAPQSHAEAAHHATAGVEAKAQAFMDEDTVHLAEHKNAPKRAPISVESPVAPPGDDANGPHDEDDGAGVHEATGATSFFEELLEVGVWYPPILKTVAHKTQGLNEVVDLVDRHLEHIVSTGTREQKRHVRADRELRANMRDAMLLELEDRESLRARFHELVDLIAARNADPHSAAAELIAHFKSNEVDSS